MKKTLFALFISLSLVFAFLPATALASPTWDSITYGGSYRVYNFADLETVANYSSVNKLQMLGSTYTFTSNISSQDTLYIAADATVTMDLNEYYFYGTIKNYGTLTITNGTLWGSSGPVIDNDGTLYLEDVKFTTNYATSLIDNDASGVVTIDDCTLSGNATVYSTSCIIQNEGGSVTITDTTLSGYPLKTTGGTVTLNGTTSITGDSTYGALSASGGTVTINGDCAITYDISLTGGAKLEVADEVAIDVSGDISIDATSTLLLNNYVTLNMDDAFASDGSITNAGTITLDSNAHLIVYEDFTNTGTLTVPGYASLTVYGTLSNSGTLSNNGTIYTTTGTITGTAATGTGGLSQPTMTTSRAVEAALNQGYAVTLAGTITDADITVDAGVTTSLDLNNLTLSSTSGRILYNKGTLTVKNGTISLVYSGSSSTYPINNYAGSLTLENCTVQANLTYTGSSTSSAGYAIYNAYNGSVSTTNSTISVSSDAVTTYGLYVYQDSTASIGDGTVISATNTNTGNAYAVALTHATAQATVSGNVSATGDVLFETTGAALTIADGATFTLDGAITASDDVTTSVTNNGTFVASNVSTADELTAALAVDGNVSITLTADIAANITIDTAQTVTLNLGEYTLSSDEGATIATITNNGTLSINDGIVTSASGKTIANNGTLSMAGSTVTSTYTDGDDAAYAIYNAGAATALTVTDTTLTTTADGVALYNISNAGSVALSGVTLNSGVAGAYGTALYGNGSGSTITCSGTVAVNGDASVVSGNLAVAAGATLNVAGDASLATDSSASTGTASLSVGGDLNIAGNFALASAASVTNSGTIDVDGTLATASGASITNSGTIAAYESDIADTSGISGEGDLVVAQITTAYTLQAAIDAAGSTPTSLTLADNIATTSPISITEVADITLNLAGHTLSSTTTQTVLTYGDLTINGGGTADAPGTIANTGGGYAIYATGGTLSVNNAAVTLDTTTVAYAIYTTSTAALTITDSTVTSNSSTTNATALLLDASGATNISGSTIAATTDSTNSSAIAISHGANAGALTLAGSIGVTGNVSNASVMTLAENASVAVTGNVSNTGTMTVNTGASLAVTGELSIGEGATLTNDGTITAEPYTNNGTDNASGDGTINDEPTVPTDPEPDPDDDPDEDILDASVLQAIIDAASDDAIIILNDDYSGQVAFSIPEGETITLDLNGHALSYDYVGDNVKGVVAVHGTGELIIIDTSEEKSGTITGTSDACAVVVSTGALTIKGGTFEGRAAVLLYDTGSVTIHDGTFHGDESGNTWASSISGAAVKAYNGNITINDGTFTSVGCNVVWIEGSDIASVTGSINGGTFTATYEGATLTDAFEPMALLIGQNTEIDVTGGTFSGYACGVNITGGDVEITGGTFTSTAFSAILIAGGDVEITGGTFTNEECLGLYIFSGDYNDDSVVTIDGGEFIGGTFSGGEIISGTVTINDGTFTSAHNAGLYVGAYDFYYDGSYYIYSDVTITGGTFNGDEDAVYLDTTNNTESEYSTVAISGGTFSSDVSDYLIEGYGISANNGTWVVAEATAGVATIGTTEYGTLAEAVEAAGSDDTTITVLCDIAEDITIPATANITLDLGTYTLSGSAGKTLTVQGNGTLTVQGNGTVENTSGTDYAIYIAQGATLTVASGSDLSVSNAVSAAQTVVEQALSAATYLSYSSPAMMLTANTAEESASAIIVDGTLVVEGDIDTDADVTVSSTGTLTVDSTATLDVEGELSIAEGASLANDGTINATTTSIETTVITGEGTVNGETLTEEEEEEQSDGVIDTEAELIAAIEAGGMVSLAASIELSSPITITTALTLDGNSNTLSVESGDSIFLLGSEGGDNDFNVTLSNLTLRGNSDGVHGDDTGDSVITNAADSTGTKIAYTGDLTLNSCTIEDFNWMGVSIQGDGASAGGTLTVANSAFDTGTPAASAGTDWVYAIQTTYAYSADVDSTTFTNSLGDTGSMVGFATSSNSGTYTIDDSEFIDVDYAVYSTGTATVTETNNTYTSTTEPEEDDEEEPSDGVIDTEEELLDAIAAGGTVSLDADITLSEAATITTGLTLVGNGYTLSVESGDAIFLLGSEDGSNDFDVSISTLTLSGNSDGVHSGGATGDSVITNAADSTGAKIAYTGDLTLSYCTIENFNWMGVSIRGGGASAGGTLTVANSAFDTGTPAADAGTNWVYAIQTSYAYSVDIDDTTFTNSLGDTGSMVGFANGNTSGTYTIDDSEFIDVDYAVYSTGTATVIETNNTYTSTTEPDEEDEGDGTIDTEAAFLAAFEAGGNVITLDDDITLGEATEISITTDLTIVGGGYTLTIGDGATVIVGEVVFGTLSIDDEEEEITSDDATTSSDLTATLTITDGNLTVTEGGYLNVTEGTALIVDGTLTVTDTGIVFNNGTIYTTTGEIEGEGSLQGNGELMYIGEEDEIEEEKNVSLKISGGDSAQYRVEIIWGAMEFEYQTGGLWDTFTHTYGGGESSEGWVTDSLDGTNNAITVTNHSNRAVSVAFEYNALVDGTDLVGNFFADNADALEAALVLDTEAKTVENTIENNVLLLHNASGYYDDEGTLWTWDSGEGEDYLAMTLERGFANVVYFAFSGTPNTDVTSSFTDFTEIGVINVVVSQLTDLSGFEYDENGDDFIVDDTAEGDIIGEASSGEGSSTEVEISTPNGEDDDTTDDSSDDSSDDSTAQLETH